MVLCLVVMFLYVVAFNIPELSFHFLSASRLTSYRTVISFLCRKLYYKLLVVASATTNKAGSQLARCEQPTTIK